MKYFPLWGLAAYLLVTPALADQTGDEAAAADAEGMTAEQFEASLNYQQGKVALPGGKTELVVPKNFRYLGPEDAERVLVDAWGNPDGSGTLGMLFPADLGPTDEHGWGVVITYDDDGHVSDEDADAIDYTQMLADMQAGAEEENAQREAAGYAPVHLVGWAETPSYDTTSKKLYWAKELNFGGDDQNILNYNVRVLGRDGVLVLNAVANMDQLGMIRDRMQEVIAFSNFTAGNQYADFDPSTDKVAAYGLAALVGGTLAAKTGLLAKLMALLVAGKKFVIIFLIAIGAMLKPLFSRKRRDQDQDNVEA